MGPRDACGQAESKAASSSQPPGASPPPGCRREGCEGTQGAQVAGAAPSHRPTGPFRIRLTCSPGSRRGPGQPQTTTCPAQGRTAGSGAGVLPAGPVVRVGWWGSGIAGARGRAAGWPLRRAAAASPVGFSGCPGTHGPVQPASRPGCGSSGRGPAQGKQQAGSGHGQRRSEVPAL